ncbi:MAG: HupE/UreJ family protein [Paenibacillaceae bacterium]|nr:HupE/UreJ family protein [Paenibacillaceae bacterium]
MRAGIYLLLGLQACLFLIVPAASAHAVNNGYTEASIDGNRVHMEMTLSQSLFPAYDTDRDGAISEQELTQQQQKLRTLIDRHFELMAPEGKLQLEQMDAAPGIQEGIPVIHFRIDYTAINNINQLHVNYSLFIQDTDPQHQNYLTFYQGNDVIGHTVLEKGHETYDLHGGKPEMYTSPLWGFGVLGGRIIVDGVSPLLFLLCVALSGKTLDKAINAVLVMIIAHAAVTLTCFHFGLSISASLQVWWEAGAWAAILGLAVGVLLRGRGFWKATMAMAALYGLSHGLDTMSGNRPLADAEQFSRIIAYHIGAIASLSVVLYMAFQLILLVQKIRGMSRGKNERG